MNRISRLHLAAFVSTATGPLALRVWTTELTMNMTVEIMFWSLFLQVCNKPCLLKRLSAVDIKYFCLIIFISRLPLESQRDRGRSWILDLGPFWLLAMLVLHYTAFCKKVLLLGTLSKQCLYVHYWACITKVSTPRFYSDGGKRFRLIQHEFWTDLSNANIW